MSDISNLPGLIKKYPLPWHTAMGGDIKNFQGVWICNAGSMATEIAELANSCGKLADALTALKEENERLRENGQFLLDRLSEVELTDDMPKDFLRDWMGHVEPAIARCRAALTGKGGGGG